MHRPLNIIAVGFVWFACLCVAAPMPGNGATMAEVAQKIKSLKPQDKIHHLLKGAQAEGELVYYGTLPINEFLPLARLFNSRYRSIALQHYFRCAPFNPLLHPPRTRGRNRGRGLNVLNDLNGLNSKRDHETRTR